jgi:uncharacterized protein (DUF1919 family)
MVNVVAIVDKIWGGIINKVDGIPVTKPERLKDDTLKFDYLIVTALNENTFEEIIREATEMGIQREIILPASIFWIPFFNFEEYIQIKNSNVSILSDYCFAGYLYHRFGMKFTSPTINMFADNDNYIRFLQNLEKYMNEPMTEVKNTVDNCYKNIFTYPRGMIGDVEWQFNHDVCFSTAAERWKRGVERFNWDNYIAIMTIENDEMAYKFETLPIKNKIGFYWKDLNLDSIIYMPTWQNPEIRKNCGYAFSALVNRVADGTYGYGTINWMKALLHQCGYSRTE